MKPIVCDASGCKEPPTIAFHGHLQTDLVLDGVGITMAAFHRTSRGRERLRLCARCAAKCGIEMISAREVYGSTAP